MSDRRGKVEGVQVEGAELVLRRLARDQWVRLHGTPRISVLVGDADACRWWQEWITIGGLSGELLAEGDLDANLRAAAARAVATPEMPIAVLAKEGELAVWRAGRTDRLAAMVDEGTLIVRSSEPRAVVLFDARSAAEAALFEALEATPTTAGRFEPNGKLSVMFGSQAAEVDLLSRVDRIAIEIDGYHHFTDPECYRRERRKDLLLQSQGLFEIRLLAEDVLRDPRGSVTVVCQALAYRLGEKR